MWAGFKKWRWLHYIEDDDRVVCFSCVQAVGKGLIKEESVWLDSCLVRGGFTNWQKAKEKFKEHEKTKLHRGALQKLSALKTTPINALSSDAACKGQNTARHVLEMTFQSVLLCDTHQPFPFLMLPSTAHGDFCTTITWTAAVTECLPLPRWLAPWKVLLTHSCSGSIVYVNKIIQM